MILILPFKSISPVKAIVLFTGICVNNDIIANDHEILDYCHSAVVFSLRNAHPDTLHDGLLSGEPLSGNPYPLREHSTDRRR